MPLRVVEVEGDCRQRGIQFGEKCKAEIERTLANNYRIIQYVCGISREEAISRAKFLIPYAKKAAPDLCEEIQGVADGSSTSFEDVFVLNAVPEVMRMTSGGCTVISVGGEHAESGKRVTGQTIDWNPLLEDQYLVLKAMPEKGPSFLTYTVAGLLALVGINSEGIGSFINIFLTNEEIIQGMPAYLILRRILEQDRIGKTVSTIAFEKRASPFNYTVTDKSGELYIIEALIDDYEIISDGREFLVHTNHLLTERFRQKDIYVDVSRNPETLTRYYRVTHLLRQSLSRKTKLGIEDFRQMLADHANYPDSVCRHEDDSVKFPEGRYKTLAALIYEQGSKNLLINQGNPCQNSYIEYKLD